MDCVSDGDCVNVAGRPVCFQGACVECLQTDDCPWRRRMQWCARMAMSLNAMLGRELSRLERAATKRQVAASSPTGHLAV